MPRIAIRRRLTVAALAVLAACTGDTTTPPAAVVTTMQAATPTTIDAVIGAQHPQWMAVQVLDQFSRPIAGVPVTWTVLAGGGAVQGVEQQTNAEGVVHAYWTLGLRLDGEHRLQASAQGTTPVVFTATPRYPDPGNIIPNVTVATQGTATAGAPLPVVLTFRTPSGQPVAGAPVTFAVSSGGGTVTPATTTTDSLGRATATWTLGTTAGSQQDLLWTVLGTGVGLRVTPAAAGASAIAVVKASPDWTIPGRTQEVGVVVRDTYGNPVADVPVSWTVTAGTGSVPGTPTLTNAEGTAYVTWRLGTTEGVTERIQASVTGLAPVAFATTVKAFFFLIISPPSPGPGATVAGPQLTVEAYTYPWSAGGQAFNVPSMTLTVSDRTADFIVVPAPFRWRATVSLAGLPAGTHTYTVNATDIDGRTHSESVVFTYAP